MTGPRIRPRILPHLAVIAALVTALLPLRTLLDSGWFAETVCLVVAIVATGYAGRWIRGSVALAAQLIAWCIGVCWAYPGGIGGLVGVDGWGLPHVIEAASTQVMTSVAPLGAGAPLRFVLVAAVGLLTLLIDGLANARHAPLVAVLPLTAVFIAPQLAVPNGDHLLYAVIFAIALLLLVASRGSRTPRTRSATASVAIVLLAACVGVVAIPAIPFAPTNGISLYTRPTSVDVSINLGDDLRNRSNVEVMRLYTNLAAAPYLRLATHTRLDDDGWHVDSGSSHPLAEGFAPLDADPELEYAGRTTWIDHVRLDTPYLPLPGNALSVDGAGGSWQASDDNRTARTRSGSVQGLEYRVESVELLPTHDQFETFPAGLGPGPALEVSPSVTNGIIGQYARQVTADAPTAYDKAIALQAWLRSSEFGYSLDTPVADGFDGSDIEAIERFLEVREGYCVHFASAFTLMARSLGLPTRIAIGYLPGTSTGDRVDGRPVYSVTADRLHAWPEVYLDGSGWTRFDPTPAVAQAQSVTASDEEPEPEPEPEPTAPETATPDPTPSASEATAPDRSPTTAVPDAPIARHHIAWWPFAVLGVIVLAALPWIVRRGIRHARLAAAHRGDALAAWRHKHMLTVERIIGMKTGTGGSEGAAYLARVREAMAAPSAVGRNSPRAANSFRPSCSSSWRMRWLTALGVTLSSAAACVTLRRRAFTASTTSALLTSRRFRRSARATASWSPRTSSVKAWSRVMSTDSRNLSRFCLETFPGSPLPFSSCRHLCRRAPRPGATPC